MPSNKLMFESEREWHTFYESHRFSFKEWDNFLMFFRLDGDMAITVPSRRLGDDGKPEKELTIKLRDLPKHKGGIANLKLGVQTENKLVTFETSGAFFKAGYEKDGVK
jgi:hypothetical protein